MSKPHDVFPVLLVAAHFRVRPLTNSIGSEIVSAYRLEAGTTTRYTVSVASPSSRVMRVTG